MCLMPFRWDSTVIGSITVDLDGLQIPGVPFFLLSQSSSGVMDSWLLPLLYFRLRYQLMI